MTGRRAAPRQGAGCDLQGGAAPSRALLGTKWLMSPEPGWSPGRGEACVDGIVLATAFPCSNFPCGADGERISSVPSRWRVGFTGGQGHPCPGILWNVTGCNANIPGWSPEPFAPDTAPAARPQEGFSSWCRGAWRYRLCGMGQGHGKRCQPSPEPCLAPPCEPGTTGEPSTTGYSRLWVHPQSPKQHRGRAGADPARGGGSWADVWGLWCTVWRGLANSSKSIEPKGRM